MNVMAFHRQRYLAGNMMLVGSGRSLFRPLP